MTKAIFYIVFAVGVIGLSSCRVSKEALTDKHFPNRKSDEVLQLMQENEVNCEWLSIKYDVELKTPKIDDSFKMYVRMRKDSVIWVSATYYAVEVARFLFTPDSVKFMDRKNNQYYVGEYDYISERFQVDANFNVLQSLILANSAELLKVESEDDKMKSSKSDGNYYLSVLRKRQLRRALKRDEIKKDLDLGISVWVQPENFRISKTTIADFESDRSITAVFSDYEKTCNSLFPKKVNYTALSANEQAEVKTSAMKVTPDKKVSLSFTIPEKYEPLVP